MSSGEEEIGSTSARRSPDGGWVSGRASIVEPAAFSAPLGPADAVLCFSEKIFSHLIDAFALADRGSGPRLPGGLEGRVGEDVAVYRGCFGAPAAAALMEALVASGAERFVMVGQAGSISPRCRIGDVLLPTWGVREEGTSYHYLPPEVRCRASETLLSAMRTWVAGIETMEGGVWTTDALFRETAEKARAFAREGVLAVEMECTALMAVAAYRGVAFAAALIITDELFSGAWVQGFRSKGVKRSQERVCQALAEGFQARSQPGGG